MKTGVETGCPVIKVETGVGTGGPAIEVEGPETGDPAINEETGVERWSCYQSGGRNADLTPET